MHSKRALIRTITRFLYAGGLVFLIVGMLLSALSTSVMAAGGPPLGALQDATQTPSAGETATSAAAATQTAVCLLCRTVTPVVTNPTATSTPVPGQPTSTPAPTHAPMVLNLSNICGYPSDTLTQWKVANPNNTDMNYTWRVVGSDESGSGTVRANSDDYFTTRFGVTVRLYVGDQLVDTEACLAPCKKELQLAYTCTANGLTWTATNPNNFPVSYTVRVDNQETGRGAIPAGSTVSVASTTPGAHTVDLTWTDTRPGSHTVRLESPPNSCTVQVQTDTPTPTATSTTPVEITATFTPTPTATSTTPVEITSTFTVTPTVTQTSLPDVIPSFTPTPTVTFTATTGPSPTFTATPTVTQTSLPDVIPSFTPTPTVTFTATTDPSPTFTATPTVTQTSLPGVIPSFTATSTNTPTTTLTALPGFVPSATPIGTLAPPASTVTSTPVLIPVTGVDLTLPIGANSLAIFGSLLTNIGLFTIGLALALTGIGTQIKK